MQAVEDKRSPGHLHINTHPEYSLSDGRPIRTGSGAGDAPPQVCVVLSGVRESSRDVVVVRHGGNWECKLTTLCGQVLHSAGSYRFDEHIEKAHTPSHKAKTREGVGVSGTGQSRWTKAKAAVTMGSLRSRENGQPGATVVDV